MKQGFSQYLASDYSGIDIPKVGIKLYYGYEVTDKNDDWCFEATFPNGKVTIPFTALKLADDSIDQFDCDSCLKTGIAMLIERGDLIP